MRDGTKLYACAYVPKKLEGKSGILLERTPYSAGPYGDSFRDLPGGGFAKDNFIFAYADVRGKYESEGMFEDIRPQLGAKHSPTAIDESTDTYDTIDYLVKHVPKNNGNVGLWGISYPGFYAEIGAVNSHPALKAASPQAPVSEWFMGDDWHHNGCLFLQDAFDFMSWFGTVQTKPTPDHFGITINRGSAAAYDFYLKVGALPNFDTNYYKGRIPFWNEVLAHDTYDSWWKARSVPSKLTGVKCPLLFVGGEFDAEDMYGALHSYESSKKLNPVPVSLCFGPWFHGMWAGSGGSSLGPLQFGSPTSDYFQQNIELPFFEKYLLGRKETPALPAATVFNTGANKWRQFSVWPPKGQSETIYLNADGRLATNKPDGDDEGRTYTADPSAPTPYVEDYKTSRGRPLSFMDSDQTWASNRSDVLTYVMPEETQDVTYAGPIGVDLWASTTGTDGDFIVKVIDQYPADSTETNAKGESLAGKQILIRWDVMRAKFRHSFSKPEAMVPGQPEEIKFDLNSICHSFRKGHHIEIQIQSSLFPLVDRNLNQFENINQAKDADFISAKVKIFSDAAHPSSVRFTKIDN